MKIREPHLLKWKPVAKGKGEKAITIGYILIFLISILAFYIPVNYHAKLILFNTDILMSEEFLQDWWIRGADMKRWMTPGAPNYFPDMLFYGLFRFATGKVYLGFIGFAFTKIMFYVVFLYKFLSEITNNSKIKNIWFSLLGTSILLLAVFPLNNQLTLELNSDFWQLFSIGWHGGAITNAMISILIILKWLKNPNKNNLWLFLLFILSIVADLSDRFYFVWLSLPILGSVIVLLLIKRIKWRSVFLLSGVMLISDLTGRLIFDWLTPFQVIPYNISFTSGFMATLKFYFNLVTGSWYHSFVLFSYICLVCITIFILFKAIKERNIPVRPKNNRTTETPRLLLLLYASMVLPIGFLSMALINRPETWYFVGGNLLALSLWAFLFVMSPFGKKLFEKLWFHSIIFSILFIYFGIMAISSSDEIATIMVPANPYTELVACLDSHADDLYGKIGFADYWQARSINIFSQENLRIDQVMGENLDVLEFGSNQGKLETRKHTFVITNTPTGFPQILEKDIVRLNGEPDARIVCNGFPVLIYKGGVGISDRRLSLTEQILGLSQRGVDNDTIFIPSDLWLTLVGEWQDNILYSTGEQGVLIYGPYITLPAGSYRVDWIGQIEPNKQNEVGSIDIAYDTDAIILEHAIITQKSLAEQPKGKLATLEFSIDHDTPLVQFRLILNENVIVELQEVLITLIEND